MTRARLQKSKSVTNVDGSGATLSLGPLAQGPANWDVDAILWQVQQNARIGKAPIPRIQVYIDHADPSGVQCQSYDGSFGSAGGNASISRGSNFIAVWTGGQAGDIYSLTLTGEQF